MLNFDWSNDTLFFTYEWWEETSQWDTGPCVRWIHEYHERLYKARVPLAFKDNDDAIEHFLMWVVDNYPDEPGFWVT
jgi:hypothetical protein